LIEIDDSVSTSRDQPWLLGVKGDGTHSYATYWLMSSKDLQRDHEWIASEVADNHNT
jgi:hypothetical protein